MPGLPIVGAELTVHVNVPDEPVAPSASVTVTVISVYVPAGPEIVPVTDPVLVMDTPAGALLLKEYEHGEFGHVLVRLKLTTLPTLLV